MIKKFVLIAILFVLSNIGFAGAADKENVHILRGRCTEKSVTATGNFGENLDKYRSSISCDSVTLTDFSGGRTLVQFTGSSGAYGFTFTPDDEGVGPVIRLWKDGKMFPATDGICRFNATKHTIMCAGRSIMGRSERITIVFFEG